MEKGVQNVKVGPWAVQILRKYFGSFSEHEKNILADVDIEHLHKTRVALRRLRTALRVFENAVEFPEPVTGKRIGTIVRRLGAVRDLDVFKIHVEACRGACTGLLQQIRLDEIIQFLSSARGKEFRKLRSHIESPSYAEFTGAFQIWVARPLFNNLLADRLTEPLLANFILPGINELFLHPGLYVGVDIDGKPRRRAPAPGFFEKQDASLHSLRRHIKRTRYAMEFFQEFYSEKFRSYIKQLEEAQECLGVVHDHVVIENLLTSHFDPNWRRSSAFAALFFDQQKRRFWKRWQAIQKNLLHTDVQKAWLHEIMLPQTTGKRK